MLKTCCDERDAKLRSKRVIIPKTKDHVGVLTCLAQEVILDDLNFVHGELVLAFSRVDIDQDPLGTLDLIIVQERGVQCFLLLPLVLARDDSFAFYDSEARLDFRERLEWLCRVRGRKL